SGLKAPGVSIADVNCCGFKIKVNEPAVRKESELNNVSLDVHNKETVGWLAYSVNSIQPYYGAKQIS
ncbi:MAG: hypothetical protein GY807_04580, partial [Gammaproteobacteria bacterium]|nr:hypothetical protein [Gammaproteobacteria bacterium]